MGLLVLMELLLLIVIVLDFVFTTNADGILELVAKEHEDNDAAKLDAEVAPLTSSVSSEEGDRGGNHVGTNEG